MIRKKKDKLCVCVPVNTSVYTCVYMAHTCSCAKDQVGECWGGLHADMYLGCMYVCVVHMSVHGTQMQLCKESDRRMLGWSACRYVCIGCMYVYVCVSMWEVHTYVHAYLYVHA